MLVEGTSFNEHSVLSELSGVADSITGETFEVLREMSPQLDPAFGHGINANENGLEN